MVFKFQCPDNSHPFFSFFEPFQNWFPGTHTEIGVLHPRRLPTSVAYFLHEIYQETAASKEESSPTSIIKWVSGRLGINRTLPQAASNPGSSHCYNSQKAQNTHQSGTYRRPLPNSSGFSQLPSSCTHVCMLLLTPTATTALRPHQSTAKSSPTRLRGARRTRRQHPEELLCRRCISVLRCIAHSKHAVRLRTSWCWDTAL